LEQQATNNPTSAAYPAALGQAFIHQIATTKDTRQYALLGLKADQNFDAALEIDPKFWEARFFKAHSMSYWPTEMNKGNEVVSRFTQLIQDQEAQTAQPHFAQSYVWLGEHYQKTGQAQYANQVWRRGAALFPAETMLQQKLAASR
jgi:tetratricopeptide (TPR) repeat protein